MPSWIMILPNNAFTRTGETGAHLPVKDMVGKGIGPAKVTRSLARR